MNKADQKFFLVREDVLPEAMKKTLDAKEMIERGKADSVWEAVQKVDLSRSAFYKYRDTVFPFHTIVKEKLITLFFYLEDRSGTLSELLRRGRLIWLQHHDDSPNDSLTGSCQRYALAQHEWDDDGY